VAHIFAAVMYQVILTRDDIFFSKFLAALFFQSLLVSQMSFESTSCQNCHLKRRFSNFLRNRKNFMHFSTFPEPSDKTRHTKNFFFIR